MSDLAERLQQVIADLIPCCDAVDEAACNVMREAAAALREKDAEIERLKAAGEMLAAVTQGAMEEFVRVPYGASHEDVAAINDWHKMAAEAMAEWEST